MSSFDEAQRPEDNVVEGNAESKEHLLPPQPFPVQLHNILTIEIVAKRFPVPLPSDSTLAAQSNINLEEIQINQETSQAQAILSVQVGFTDEPRPFEISFKLLGLFMYNSQEYSAAMVHQFLNQGSLSIMLPFARELLISLCTRLQVPLLILQMIHATPPSLSEEPGKGSTN